MATINIQLYTDGGNRNTGNVKGGSVRPTDKSAWAALLLYDGHKKLLAGADYGRTNNSMEITAVIEGLRAIKKPELPVDVFSDSAYVVNTMNEQWWVNWQKSGWQKKGKPVINAELWQALLAQIARFKTPPVFHKVKGHATNLHNNEVDAALNKAMDQLPARRQ